MLSKQADTAASYIFSNNLQVWRSGNLYLYLNYIYTRSLGSLRPFGPPFALLLALRASLVFWKTQPTFFCRFFFLRFFLDFYLFRFSGFCVDDDDEDLLSPVKQSNGDCLKVAALRMESRQQMSRIFCDGQTDRGIAHSSS